MLDDVSDLSFVWIEQRDRGKSFAMLLRPADGMKSKSCSAAAIGRCIHRAAVLRRSASRPELEMTIGRLKVRFANCLTWSEELLSFASQESSAPRGGPRVLGRRDDIGQTRSKLKKWTIWPPRSTVSFYAEPSGQALEHVEAVRLKTW